MFANVEGMRIYYERSDSGGTPVVLMHGWGCSVDVMRRVYDKLSRLDKTVIAFDFPGFGRSDLPHRAFSVYDYARVAAGLFAALGLEKPDVIAHSFGGRETAIQPCSRAQNSVV